MEGSQQARSMKPLLLKLGVALALSIFGYLRLRPRRFPPTNPSPGDKPFTGAGLEDELDILTSVINGTSTAATTAVMERSPSSKSSGDEEGFLLPEFNQLVMKELEASGRDPETILTAAPVSSKLEIEKELALEEEIAYLRNLVESLHERERALEIKMLEYHGLREQEAATSELENRLKINTTEAKLFSLKIESLQAENRRLQAQMSDYPRAMDELESARAQIQFLKRKLKSDGEQVKEKLSTLDQRITTLQDREHKDGGDDAEAEKKSRRLKELEHEVMDLRMVNSRLAEENMELKWKSTQMLSSSVLNHPELEPVGEADHLREENDELKKETGQLRTDRCLDVEELVYLRWINACLRYELRNYQGPPGKTVARDLSKSLSPKSEQKVKQLVVEYADFGIDERNTGLIDFDLDCCSSQASTEESDDTFGDVSRNRSSRKSMFISKLKKLVLGKYHHSKKASLVDRTPTSCGNSDRRASASPCSFEEAIGRGSNDSFSSCISEELASANQLTRHFSEQWQDKGPQPQSFARPPLDIHRPRKLNLQVIKAGNAERCKSDVGTSSLYRSMMSGGDGLIDLSPNSSLDHVDIDVPEKVELRKFAEALKSSRGSPKLKRRAASFSFS